MHEALSQKNGPSFWKSWKSRFEKTEKIVQVEGITNESDIAEKFAEFFKHCYSSNNVHRASELKNEYDVMRQGYSGFPLPVNSNFDVELISKVILDLEHGKARGLDDLSAEHLIYAHPSVVIILSKVFDLIVKHNVVPDGFRSNYVIPLPKLTGRSKSSKCNDFRGIAIAPVILKIFEHCFLKRFSNFLTSNDNQFGFKRRLGCNHAVYTTRKIVDNIVKCGGTASLCSIDLSKAFDKVNHHALYIKLMQRQLPVQLLDLIENLLVNCSSTVRWLSTYSSFFEVHYGVRQGSVLSPFLFAVYVDDIVSKRRIDYYSAIVLYADDILLIAQSVSELQKMLECCETELSWLDMSINTAKSCCIRIGKRHYIKCANIVTVSGYELRWVNEVRYLGNYIVSARYFKCSLSKCKRSFYSATNAIFGKIGRIASEEVFLHLMYSKCVPILMYGLECYDMTKTDLKSLDFTVTRVLMKLFRTTNMDIITDCMHFFVVKLPSEMWRDRVDRFAKNYTRNINRLCHLYADVM